MPRTRAGVLVALRPPTPEPRDDRRAHHVAQHRARSLLALGLAVAAALVTLLVALRAPVVRGWDRDLSRTAAGWQDVAVLAWIDDLGRTGVAAVVSLAAAALLRRRSPHLALAYPAAVLVGLGLNALLKVVIDRPRPVSPLVGTSLPSYPSGHTIQVTILALFVTATVHEVAHRRWLTATAGALLGTAAVLTGVSRVVFAAHWPSDVVGGALLAATVAAVTRVALRLRVVDEEGDQSLLLLPEPMERGARWVARALLVALVPLSIALSAAGSPGPGGGTLGPRLLQLAVLGLVVASTAVAWRWEAAGATFLAVAGTAMALTASVRYPPVAAVAVSVAFLLPALLLWIAWQNGRPVRSLVALAVVGAVLLAGTWSVATSVYDPPTEPGAIGVVDDGVVGP